MEKIFQQKLMQELGVSAETFEQALRQAKEKNSVLVHVLIEMGVGDPEKILQIFSKSYNIQYANLASMDIPENIIDLIPKDLAQRSVIVPIDRVGNHIIIAMANPHDLKLIDLIRFKTGYSPKPVIAALPDLNAALERYYKVKAFDITDFSASKGEVVTRRKEARAVISETSETDQSTPIIRLVDQILLQCVARQASDIHIEPYENQLRVRLRVDGELIEIARPPVEFTSALTSRIKIMAGLDIAEKRLPQDGGIRVTIANKPIDFRVNSLPTIHGEKIVMRLLDKSSLRVDLTKLGFEKDDYERFREAIYRPYGMVLVTGPTGSGKTTTLYSALAELNKITDNVVTAEDPVEFNLEGINQVQINAQIEFDFATALRAFLRQDPDVIMVGEIRDLQTGEIAIKAALTGHLVLSTLHTNSAADTIIRLQNMGLEPFNLISALNAIVAQRLTRKICDKCRVPDETIKRDHLIQLGIHPNFVDKIKTFRGSGCSNCNKSGYRGRIAVHEVMVLNDPIRDAIMKRKTSVDLKKIAMQHGMRTLRQNAINKMVRGEIDFWEVVKNTASDTDNVVGQMDQAS